MAKKLTEEQKEKKRAYWRARKQKRRLSTDPEVQRKRLEQIKRRNAKYRAKHRERLLAYHREYNKAYFQANPRTKAALTPERLEHKRVTGRAYYAANRERLAARALFLKKQRMAAWTAEQWAVYRAQRAAYVRLRRARLKAANQSPPQT